MKGAVLSLLHGVKQRFLRLMGVPEPPQGPEVGPLVEILAGHGQDGGGHGPPQRLGIGPHGEHPRVEGDADPGEEANI